MGDESDRQHPESGEDGDSDGHDVHAEFEGSCGCAEIWEYMAEQRRSD